MAVNFNYELDTLYSKAFFDFDLIDDQKYFINMLPGAIEDFFGQQNDTLSYQLSTGVYSDYGNLKVFINGAITYPILVQLVDKNEEVYREEYLLEAKEINFNFLEVGSYYLRVIFDTNKNRKWDTGHYLKGIQPERVAHFPDIIEIRANWDEIKTFVIAE